MRILQLLNGVVKFIAVFLLFLVFFSSVIVISILFIFSSRASKRLIVSGLIRFFAIGLVKIINIRVKVSGNKIQKKGVGLFLVSNHLSYCDGFIIGSIFPIIYVGKAELKHWPLIGLMSDFSGTLFIDRSRRNHVSEYIDSIAETLKGGANVLFFPEGTSTCGDELLPFKPSFFYAALNAGAPIVALSLIYRSIDGEPVDQKNRDKVYWYGEMTFFDHFFRLLCCRGLEADVKIHPMVNSVFRDENLSRKSVCESAYGAILSDIKESRGQYA